MSKPTKSDIKEFVYSCSETGSNNYNDFLKHITEIIESDCRAFIVDGEVFWNSYLTYKRYKPYLQQINEDIVRSHLIKNAHSLFSKINRSKNNVEIEISMFPYESSYTILVTYDALNQTYKISVPNEFC